MGAVGKARKPLSDETANLGLRAYAGENGMKLTRLKERKRYNLHFTEGSPVSMHLFDNTRLSGPGYEDALLRVRSYIFRDHRVRRKGRGF